MRVKVTKDFGSGDADFKTGQEFDTDNPSLISVAKDPSFESLVEIKPKKASTKNTSKSKTKNQGGT